MKTRIGIAIQEGEEGEDFIWPLNLNTRQSFAGDRDSAAAFFTDAGAGTWRKAEISQVCNNAAEITGCDLANCEIISYVNQVYYSKLDEALGSRS